MSTFRNKTAMSRQVSLSPLRLASCLDRAGERISRVIGERLSRSGSTGLPVHVDFSVLQDRSGPFELVALDCREEG